MSYETFTNKVAMTFKPSGKVGINIHPGHVIDGATVVEVTNTGERQWIFFTGRVASYKNVLLKKTNL